MSASAAPSSASPSAPSESSKRRCRSGMRANRLAYAAPLTAKTVVTAALWLSGSVRALGGRDDVEHRLLVAGAQQRDRVGLAVDDALEERLAVLVGRQRALGPAARVVEHDRQARVLLAEQLADLALHPLGERRRRARGRDRDRQRTGADDRREDEVAQRRDVDDVHEHRAPLGVVEDGDVDVGVVRAGDDHERALEVGRLVLALLPADRALRGELSQRLDRVWRDEPDGRVAGQQALDLLEADVASADDETAPAAELQAGDVERRLEHVAHAGLVADPLAELADTLFPGVGLCRHDPNKGSPRRAST